MHVCWAAVFLPEFTVFSSRRAKLCRDFSGHSADEMHGGEDEAATGGPQLDRSEPSPLISAGNTAEMLSVAGHPPIVSLLITQGEPILLSVLVHL